MTAPRIGYLLLMRERVMTGEHETGPLLALAERAKSLGFASIWVGDSVTARPRHDPMTLMAAVAARTRRVWIGTAVLLPALRNPVLLAHQWATLEPDLRGARDPRRGHRLGRAEHLRPVRGLRRTLGEASWPNDGRAAPVPRDGPASPSNGTAAGG